MSSSSDVVAPHTDTTTLAVRTFGWCVLGVLAAYLANNYLTVSQGWPGVAPLLGSGEATSKSFVQALVYLAGAVAALAYVLSSRKQSLRADSQLITRFNTYLVRGAFWAVLFVGVADMAISFLRVEGHLAAIVGQELTQQLGRSQYRGPSVHMPLVALGFVVALFTRTLGFHWLALLIVAAELAIVITRFVFSYEQAFMGDLVRFWYAALFLFASAYTLLEEGHVRVDVFYAMFKSKTKGFVNAMGSVFLGMSVCWVILIVGMGGRSSIVNSPLLNYEISQSGFGMYTKYLMAGFLAVFAITMMIQFVSYMLDAVADFRREEGGRPHDSPHDAMSAH